MVLHRRPRHPAPLPPLPQFPLPPSLSLSTQFSQPGGGGPGKKGNSSRPRRLITFQIEGFATSDRDGETADTPGGEAARCLSDAEGLLRGGGGRRAAARAVPLMDNGGLGLEKDRANSGQTASAVFEERGQW